MDLKAGTRLLSATDATEVVVVKPPDGDVDLRCGGAPMVGADDERPAGTPAAGFDTGTLTGKRYADPDSGLEVLCTKAGEGTLSLGDAILQVKGAKPLPSSD